MKNFKRWLSFLLVLSMMFSFVPTAFADSKLNNSEENVADLVKELEARKASIEATELFPSKDGKQRVDFNTNNLIVKNMKDSIANKAGVNSGLSAEEKKYVEDVATSLSKPIGAVDIDGYPNEYINIIVWLQELPTALKDAYGHASMRLTSSYDALGSKARETIKSNYGFMSADSGKSKGSSAIRYEYSKVFAGFAMTVSVKQANEIANIAGVYAVTPDTIMYADSTEYNPDPSYGLKGMSESREVLGIGEIHTAGIDGTGVVVGVLDTGIDYNHPDLATVFKGGWNYIDPSVDYGRPESLRNDPMETTYAQWQASGQPEVNANGNDYYTDHGTHVSGTIAARATNDDSVSDRYKALGMAPNVDLYVARVLGPYGSGATSGIIAAVEDFAAGNSEKGIPKADVINLSLGSNQNTAYGDNVFALNNAVIAGVNVSVSAGNNANPSKTGKVEDRVIKTLGNPGTAYLPVTVAASQYGGTAKNFYNSVTASNTTSGSAIFGLLVEGQDISNDFDDNSVTGNPSPIYVEGKGYEAYLAFGPNDTNPTIEQLQGIPEDSLVGKILVVKRGLAFTDFLAQALRTGAGALIIVNNAANGDVYITNMAIGGTKSNSLPIFSTFHSTSAKLTDLANGSETVYLQLGDISKEQQLKYPAYFSSIGPVSPTVGLKPDIIAPGWDIISTAPAYITNGDHNDTDYSAAYQSMSGTSMSAPHMAGILALMKQRYPDATPAEIKARLMNTAKVGFVKTTDGTTEYDTSVYEVGAGFVDPYRAIMEEYGKDIYVTVIDDIPGATSGSVIENQTLSSLSFGNIEQGLNSRELSVTVTGADISDSDISIIYNDNTRYSENATENGVELKYTIPDNGEFNVWIESSADTVEGYYEGYIVITIDGKEYSMPWLVEIGNPIPPFEDLLFTAERPIVSTSTDISIRSAGASAPVNSNTNTLWFSWKGTWPTDSYGDTGIELLLVDPVTYEYKYYYGFVNLASVAYNDGTGLFAVNGFISNTARKITDAGLSPTKEKIENGAYVLLVIAGDEEYAFEDIGVVFTDGTGDYEVQLDLDTDIIVNPSEDVTTANVSGRIFSPAIEEAKDAGFIWTPSSVFWKTGNFYNIDQSFNVLGSSTGNIYISGPNAYNLYLNAGNPWICDENGYFDLTMNLDQNDKNGGYPFNFNGNHSVVGVEGFYKNENASEKNVYIGANKSTVVTPRYMLPVDKTSLADAIAIAEGKVESNYTEESWELFAAALAEAKVVYDYEDATQEDVDKALEDLIAAMDELVVKTIVGTYTVIFNSNGGSPVDSLINITSGSAITAPIAPTKSGYVFDGWYKDIELTEAWDFENDIVTENITLYAKWTEESNPEPTLYTVTFNSNGGSLVDSLINITSGSTIEAPIAPIKSGYVFAGWYKDTGFTEAWDFENDVVTENITLYAKWDNVYVPDPWEPDPIVPPTPPVPPTPATPTTPPTNPEPVVPVEFNDSTNHWAKNDIGFIAGLGLIKGTSEGVFSPDSNVTRGMIVTMLGRFANVDEASFASSSSFKDVESGKYYTSFATWAAQNEIVKGMPDGKFNPDVPLTRETLALILMNYAKAMNLQLTQSENNIEFKDANNVSSWAKDGVEWAKNFGIITGDTSQNFNPQKPITRAEVATMLARFIRLIEQ